MKKTILLLMLVVSGFAYAEPESAPPTYKAQNDSLKDSQLQSTNQQDLMEIYQQALANDPTLASALNANKAAQEIIEQGKALYRPSINFNASGARSNTDIRFLDDNIPGGRANFNTYRATIEARQPIYNKQNLVQIDQAETQVSQADKQYHLSQQELITRVTEAYFDVLIAQDQIALIKAQKEAILSQLEQAKATFEVGTSTITDVNEAQARYDLVVSQEIAARNQYLIAQRAIQAITGQLPESLSTVKADINVAPLQEGMEDWQEIARKNNLNIQIQQDALQLAEQQVELANAGHLPTLDAIASYAHSYTDGSPTPFNAGNELQNATIGLQLDIPIYLDGSVSSRARQAVLNKQKAQNDLDLAHRQTDLEAQRAYLNLNTSIAQVKALEQALISSQSQLDSTTLGYEVGVRTSIDVLNAQQQLFSAKRDLLQARYNYLVNVIRLKFATGIVAEADLQEINQQLLAASNGAQ
ncbi:MAG TPA: TolC family outer membrane protein [Methylophilaceae bacterium]|nr:TolC family outer membrane protein [Methylophilaceae bacterium]